MTLSAPEGVKVLPDQAGAGRGEEDILPLWLLRRGMLFAGPGTGVGGGDGTAHGLRGGEPSRREPRQGGAPGSPGLSLTDPQC